jgi:hypothetical protein
MFAQQRTMEVLGTSCMVEGPEIADQLKAALLTRFPGCTSAEPIHLRFARSM